MTFYKSTEDLPDFRDYSMENRTYRYFKGEPLYPFGFGLGYSRFEASHLTATREGCTVTVRNTGRRFARETVQVYVASPGQKERHNLCGIAKIELAPDEAREVSVTLRESTFSRYDEHGVLQLIPGTHRLFAGFCQPDVRSVSLYGQKPLEAEVTV